MTVWMTRSPRQSLSAVIECTHSLPPPQPPPPTTNNIKHSIQQPKPMSNSTAKKKLSEKLSSAIWRWTRWDKHVSAYNMPFPWLMGTEPVAGEQLLAGTWLKWLHGFKLKLEKSNERRRRGREPPNFYWLLFTNVYFASDNFFFSLFLSFSSSAPPRTWLRSFSLIYLGPVWSIVTTSTMTSLEVSSIAGGNAGPSQ